MDLRRSSSSETHTPVDSSVSDRLESWKEIATFLKRDVRTVQRWEAREGLPVYRHQHSKQGSIYAYKSEIDSWWKTRQPAIRQRHSKHGQSAPAIHILRSLPYPKVAICALVIIAVALSMTKAKQMFLNRRKLSQMASVSRPVTIAVAPLQGISNSSADANVATNITEELTADCRRIQGLRVVEQSAIEPLAGASGNRQPNSQVFHFDKLLRGAAGRDGDNIHLTVQLIDAASGVSIWSKTLEQSGSDVLQTERDIASTIAKDVENSLHAGA